LSIFNAAAVTVFELRLEYTIAFGKDDNPTVCRHAYLLWQRPRWQLRAVARNGFCDNWPPYGVHPELAADMHML
jgi:hypothetical protein